MKEKMKTQTIGIVYKQTIQPRDGKGWEQNMLDIRTISMRKKFLLHPNGSILYNVAYKGESMPWVKVGYFKNDEGYIYDPMSMNKPLKFTLVKTDEDEAVVQNQTHKIVVSIP